MTNSYSYLDLSSGLALLPGRLDSEGGVVAGESREEGGDSREKVELPLAVDERLLVRILEM